jgi:8-oxo-dGTP pyrophosphatase MutT (NUDIX family)
VTLPDDLPTFPPARWDDLEVRFHPAARPAQCDCRFVVVFALFEDGFVLADIPNRGWITPSGRLEPDETPRAAAVRETWEEAGAILEDPLEIGYYELRSDSEAILADAFVGTVTSFGDIPAGSESRGARLATIEELPSLYWRWDSLLETMFRYAASFRGRAAQQRL